MTNLHELVSRKTFLPKLGEFFFLKTTQTMWETQWTKTPDSQSTGIQVKRSGFNTWPGRYVVFLDKTLYCVCLSRMQMSTGEFSGKPGEMLRGNHVMN